MEYQRGRGGILTPKKRGLIVSGKYTGKIIRAGEVIDEFETENIVVNEGLNSLLNIMLDSGSQLTSWFLGVFQGNYTPIASVTAAGIAVASTECSSYTSATRPAWTPAAASGQAITNAGSAANFTFNASHTIFGAFLISDSTIAGTAGTLFSAARFASSKSVVNLDQLLLTYAFSAAST